MNWLLLKNSLVVSGLCTIISLGMGFVAALWVTGLRGQWRATVFAFAIVALALPPFLATNCWLHFLGATGVWRGWLPFNIFSLGGAIWILSLLNWPITLLLVCGAWTRLEASQLENDPAASGWSLIYAVLLPLARTALTQAGVLTLVLALNNFAVPTILQVKVFTEEIWVRFNTAFDTRGVLLLSWPLLLAPLLVLLWMQRRDIRWPRLATSISPRLFRQQLGGPWFWACGALTIVICVVSVGLPLGQILTAKRTWVELPGALAAGKWAVWSSCYYAGAAATMMSGVALLLAIAMRRRSTRKRDEGFAREGKTVETVSTTSAAAATPLKRGVNESGASETGVNETKEARCCDILRAHGSRGLLRPGTGALLFSVLVWLPFLAPGVLLGIGLIAVFNHSWSGAFYESAGIVILAFVIRYFALGWHTVTHAIRSVDRDLEDVAQLNGATRWQVFYYVHWPQIRPMAAGAWYIVFLLCLWDVESMILVTPPGGETLALRIFNLLHYGHNAQVNALCFVLMLVALLPLVAWGACRALDKSGALLRIAGCVPAQYAIRNTVLVLVGAVLLTSCSRSSTSNEASLNSRFFSRVQVIGTRGVGVGELNKPRSVAVDRQDNVFVVDMTGRVQEFSPAGTFVRFWQLPQTDKGKPKGMCRDQDGNIVVVEPHYQRVNHFSTDGKLLAQWGQYGTNAGQFTMPRAIAINSHGEAYVSEYGLVERVEKFGLQESRKQKGEGRNGESGGTNTTQAVIPKFLTTFGHMGNGPGEFNRPEGLYVDAQDRLYVADSCNHRVQIFSGDGKFIRAYGKAGTGKGELGYPYDICVDAAGNQYVCEFGNSRIQVFDANDQPIEIIGGPGAEPGKFSNPWGVALDSAGNLYVADSLNHRVQKFVRKMSVAKVEYSVFSVQYSELNTRHCIPIAPHLDMN
jgi:ABC-type Fe3+ transport system permease subunit/DNA-binding beta-propeller fold protein YncE